MSTELLKTPAAITALKQGKLLGYDTEDGVAYIRKKSSQTYEMLVKTEGEKTEHNQEAFLVLGQLSPLVFLKVLCSLRSP